MTFFSPLRSLIPGNGLTGPVTQSRWTAAVEKTLIFLFFPESPISVSLTDENFFFKFYFCAFLNIGEESLAFDILEQLTHVERFDMVLLFMSAKDKNGMCYSLFCDMKGRF